MSEELTPEEEKTSHTLGGAGKGRHKQRQVTTKFVVVEVYSNAAAPAAYTGHCPLGKLMHVVGLTKLPPKTLPTTHTQTHTHVGP